MSGIIGSAGSRSGIIGITELMIGAENALNTGTFYEEGDWDPSCNNLSNKKGRYIKIGNLIQCWGWFILDAGGSAGGTISGLPFTSMGNEDGEVQATGGGVVSYQDSDLGETWAVYVGTGSTSFVFYKGLENIQLGASKQCYYSFQYRIAPGFGYPVS